MRKPILEIVEGSEIEAQVDLSGIGIDGVFRPISVNDQGGYEMLFLTVQDARRLLEFLTEALPYLESKPHEH